MKSFFLVLLMAGTILSGCKVVISEQEDATTNAATSEESIATQKGSCEGKPNGTSESKQFYIIAQVPAGDSCEKYKAWFARICVNGQWTDWNNGQIPYYASCSVNDSAPSTLVKASKKSCGNTVDGGVEYKEFYSVKKVYGGDDCDKHKVKVSRKCNDGTWGAWDATSSIYESCTADSSQTACTPGETEQKTFYQAAVVDYGQKCSGKRFVRQCVLNSDGDYVLQNWNQVAGRTDYPASSCQVAPPLACSNGLAHGKKATYQYYTAKTSTPGNPCTKQTSTVTCNNGVLSYAPALPATTYQYCDDGISHDSCTVQGKTFQHNAIVETRISYASPVGDTTRPCQSQVQHSYCHNGKISEFDGDYVYPQCVPLSDDTKAIYSEQIVGKQDSASEITHLYSCGGTVFYQVETKYASNYSSNPVETEELYYGKTTSGQDKIVRLTADDFSYLSTMPTAVFSTRKDFLPKSFDNFQCIDNRFLLFSVKYKYPAGSSFGHGERIVGIDPALQGKNKGRVADLRLEDKYTTGQTNLSFTKSFGPSILVNQGAWSGLAGKQDETFLWQKVQHGDEENYKIAVNFKTNQGSNSFGNMDIQFLLGGSNGDYFGLSYYEYPSKKLSDYMTSAANTTTCQTSSFQKITSAFLPDPNEGGQDTFITIFSNDDQSSCTSPDAKIERSYAVRVCEIDLVMQLRCKFDSSFQIPNLNPAWLPRAEGNNRYKVVAPLMRLMNYQGDTILLVAPNDWAYQGDDELDLAEWQAYKLGYEKGKWTFTSLLQAKETNMAHNKLTSELQLFWRAALIDQLIGVSSNVKDEWHHKSLITKDKIMIFRDKLGLGMFGSQIVTNIGEIFNPALFPRGMYDKFSLEDFKNGTPYLLSNYHGWSEMSLASNGTIILVVADGDPQHRRARYIKYSSGTGWEFSLTKDSSQNKLIKIDGQLKPAVVSGTYVYFQSGVDITPLSDSDQAWKTRHPIFKVPVSNAKTVLFNHRPDGKLENPFRH